MKSKSLHDTNFVVVSAVVILTTCGATSDVDVAIITTLGF